MPGAPATGHDPSIPEPLSEGPPPYTLSLVLTLLGFFGAARPSGRRFSAWTVPAWVLRVKISPGGSLPSTQSFPLALCIRLERRRDRFGDQDRRLPLGEPDQKRLRIPLPGQRRHLGGAGGLEIPPGGPVQERDHVGTLLPDPAVP